MQAKHVSEHVLNEKEDRKLHIRRTVPTYLKHIDLASTTSYISDLASSTGYIFVISPVALAISPWSEKAASEP